MSTSTPIKITAPRLRVVVELDDGELAAIDVQTDNRDAIAFDLVRRAKRWPPADEAPMLWMSIQAWSAIKRAGGVPGLAKYKDVDDFLGRAVEVLPIDEAGNVLSNDEEDELTVDPTRPAIDSDSS